MQFEHSSDPPPIGLSGQGGKASDLLPLVYDELRRLARHLMAQEASGQTLQPTALVHEAFARLADGNAPTFESRLHFVNTAALAMRRILIERGRHVLAARHGGGRAREDVDFIDIPAATDFPPEATDALESALHELQAHNVPWSQVVHLKYFLGLTNAQTSEVLGVALATVKSDWAFAGAWLRWKVSDARL